MKKIRKRKKRRPSGGGKPCVLSKTEGQKLALFMKEHGIAKRAADDELFDQMKTTLGRDL